MDISTIAIIISALGLGITLIFNVISANRNGKQDTEEKATSIAVLNSDMGYVKSGIDDIKLKQGSTDNILRDLTSKVTKAEDSAKSAHHRIDMHEARIVKLEHGEEE